MLSLRKIVFYWLGKNEESHAIGFQLPVNRDGRDRLSNLEAKKKSKTRKIINEFSLFGLGS